MPSRRVAWALLALLVLAAVATGSGPLIGARYRAETPPALQPVADVPQGNMTLAREEADGFRFDLQGVGAFREWARPTLDVVITRIEEGDARILPTEVHLSARHNRMLEASLVEDHAYPPGTLFPVDYWTGCHGGHADYDCLMGSIRCCVEVDRNHTHVRVVLAYDIVDPLPVGSWKVGEGRVTLQANLTALPPRPG